MKKTMNLLFFIGIALLAVLIYKVEPQRIFTTLLYAYKPFLFLGIFFYILILLAGYYRWTFLLNQSESHIESRKLIEIFTLNAFVGNLSPGKASETILPALLAKNSDLSLSKSLSIVFIDRLFDLFWLAFFSTSSLLILYLAIQKETSNDLLIVIISLSMIIFFTFLFLIRNKKLHLYLGNNLPDDSIINKIYYKAGIIKNHIKFFLERPRSSKLALLSLLIWILHILKEFFMVNAFLKISFSAHFLCHSISALASLLSFIPGGLGVNALSYSYTASLIGYDWKLIATAIIINNLIFNMVRLLAVLFIKLLSKKGINS